MADQLRVLYVDDEPGLLGIGKLFLEKEGDFTVDTLTSVIEALAHLKSEQYDVIISDYQMPEMDGIAFLKHLKASGDITPFIIFTGKGREEVVIEALNEGADFYLQKGGEPKAQFAELANKIRYAVSRRRAELDLRESEERYRHVVEDQTEFICRFLPDGTHIFVNEAYCRYFGTTRDEITGTRFRPAIHPEDQEPVARLLASLTVDHPLVTIDQRVIMPDGSIRWQRWVDRGIFSPDGSLKEYQSVGRDVTDWKQAEEEIKTAEETYRNIFLNSQIGLFRTDIRTGLILDANDAVARFIGYPDRASLLATPFNIVERYADPDDHDRITSLLLSDGEFHNYEARFRKNDGLILWMRFSGRLVKEKGWVEGVSEDITERMQVKEALKDSGEQSRNLLSQMPDIVMVHQDGIIVYANDTAVEKTGFSREELIGSHLFDNVVPEDREIITRNMARRAAGELVDDYEIRMVHKSGALRHVIVRTAPIVFNGATSVVIILIDITDRKQAEEALRESEEKYRNIFENSVVGIFQTAPGGRIISVNEAFAHMYGFIDAAEMSAADFESGSPPYANLEDRQEVLHILVEKGIVKNYEAQHLKRDGTRFWVSITARTIRDTEGNVLLYEGTIIDITDRKRAEDALKHQSGTLLVLNDIISTANKADDLPGLLNTILDESLRLLDFDAGGIYLVDRSTRTANIVHSKNLPPEFLLEIQTAPIDRKPYDTLFIKNEPIITENYAQIAPDRAKKFGFKSVASIPLISKGVAVGALNIASLKRQVITEEEKQTLISIGRELGSTIERVTAEEKAKNASKNLETLFDSIDEMVFVLDMQGRILVVNNTVLNRLSYTPEELTGTDVLLLHVPERRDEALRNVQGMIAGTIDSCPVPVLAKDGTRIEVETKVTHGFWNGNEVLIGVSRDITERKRAESAITESFAIFKTVMDSLDALVYVSDMKTHEVLFINQYGKEIFGDITGKICWKSIQVDQNGPCPFCTNEKIIDLDGNPAGIIVWEFKNTINRHWYECHDSAIRWTDGRIVRIEIASDITERKRVQEALAESESFNRNLVENLPDFIAVSGMDGKLLYVNPASARTLGYDADTLIGTQVLSYIAEEYHETVIAKMTVRKEGGVASPYEIDIVTRNGLRRSVIVKATPIKYHDNPATLLLLIDIIDRKHAEEALILANKKLTLLSSITRHDINNQLMVQMGYLNLLGKKQPDATHNEYFRKVSTATKRISAMVQFTKEYENIGVNAPTWLDCRTLVDTASKQAPLGKVTVKNDLPANAEVFADPLIVKVCYNLMDNAARYGGKITTIRFSATEVGDDQVIVCEDDGDGVVAEEKEKIFERGFGKNTGLGLALAREILDITGITIKETGEPGKGARFEMTVPKGAWRITEVK